MALCIVHCFNLHVQHTLALSFSYLQQGSELKQEEEEETKKQKHPKNTSDRQYFSPSHAQTDPTI